MDSLVLNYVNFVRISVMRALRNAKSMQKWVWITVKNVLKFAVNVLRNVRRWQHNNNSYFVQQRA